MLRGRGINKSFGRGAKREQVLFDVSVEVKAGECLAVIGGSGSGKSTLTRILLGLETADSGIVEYRGLPVNVAEGSSAGSVLSGGVTAGGAAEDSVAEDSAAVGGAFASGTASSAKPLTLAGMRRLPGFQMLRQESGLVFQDPFGSLDPRWTVERSVAEPLKLSENGSEQANGQSRPANSARGEHGVRGWHRSGGQSSDAIAERVADVLRSVALDPAEFMHRYPCDLSGGQAQRVAIARAIVKRPRLILADEPMSAIDVAARVQILDALQTIVHGVGGDASGMDGVGESLDNDDASDIDGSRGSQALLDEDRGRNSSASRTADRPALIIVSHDLGVVQHLADRIVVLHKGHVVEQGETATVLGNPQHPYTKQLIAAASM
ncbi:ATP-binding cassette domain-containing protein [Bifidobacterium oedipodis]|uniref:ATP-binding cassette domain-containing protein n=1 Tax=Bifidobacterium oedipodis TaxID=2675322 RepID=UPI003AA8A76B